MCALFLHTHNYTIHNPQFLIPQNSKFRNPVGCAIVHLRVPQQAELRPSNIVRWLASWSERHCHENSGGHVRRILLWVGVQLRARRRRSSNPSHHHEKEDAASLAAIGSSNITTSAAVAAVRLQRPRGLHEVCGNGYVWRARGAAAGDRWGRRASAHLQLEG